MDTNQIVERILFCLKAGFEGLGQEEVDDVVLDLLQKAPFKPELMKTSEYIQKENLQRITSASIYTANTRDFHPEGLFSEEIFGRTTALDRFVTEAFINLNTNILHPQVYLALVSKKAMYSKIMAGTQYAKFDKTDNVFVAASPEDRGADTGYSFFLKYLGSLSKSPIKSIRKKPINILLDKYKDRLLTDQLIVLPAGVRDIKLDAVRLSQDDINKIYLSLLNLSTGLSEYTLSEDKLFDSIRNTIQIKAVELFLHIFELMNGKNGFFQKHYGSRKVTFGTRNVASAATMKSNTPDDPTNLLYDETKLPMLSVMKELQPLMIYFIKNVVYSEVFGQGSTTTVQVIDPKTLASKYITVSPKEVKRRTTSDGIESLINKFKHVRFREKSLAVFDPKRNEYWISMVYDLGNRVYIFKSLEELESLMTMKHDKTPVDKDKIRSITWAEMCYIGALVVSKAKHVYVTRYPAIEDGSIYPSRIHVLTTSPDRKVEVVSNNASIIFPHYPILGNKYNDSLTVHPGRLKGLGMDFDGDTGSINALMAEDTNKEVGDYANSLASLIDDNMKLKVGGSGDIVDLVTFNFSK